jgi:AcrR family transcriptional regulator
MILDILDDVDDHLICQVRRRRSVRKHQLLRKSKLEAAQTRVAIVAAAANLIRRTGIAEAGLADMMAAAGLTHGGFYRHFRNKEHLVSEALSAAGGKALATIGRNMAKGGLNAAVDGYLSTSHRDSPTPICPFAALGSEMARCPDNFFAARPRGKLAGDNACRSTGRTTSRWSISSTSVTSRFDDGVAALEYATDDVTDGKYASANASATDKVDLEEPCPMCPAWA